MLLIAIMSIALVTFPCLLIVTVCTSSNAVCTCSVGRFGIFSFNDPKIELNEFLSLSESYCLQFT